MILNQALLGATGPELGLSQLQLPWYGSCRSKSRGVLEELQLYFCSRLLLAVAFANFRAYLITFPHFIIFFYLQLL
jgi:hypothetical protein